jgi:protein farnesyltransferase/geranylgeranyltransferase type-1 subunit alpha
VKTLNSTELWSSEIEYSHSKILSDPRNNSAWNQRWFALHEGKIASVYAEDRGSVLSLEKAKEEASYALCGADVDPFNESPWRYLVGILMEQWRLAKRGGDADDIAKVTGLIQENIGKIREMKQAWEEHPPSNDHPYGSSASLLSALVDLIEIFTDVKELLTEAKALLGVLMSEDPVRRKYWLKREKEISKRLVSIEKKEDNAQSSARTSGW